MNWNALFFEFFLYGILFYSFLVLLLYLFIGVFSTVEIRKYLRNNSFADWKVLAASEHLPGMSILAPAYNESANIIENVRSMLSVNYSRVEVIIINDGSKDDTLPKLIREYDLYKTNTFINQQIATKKVRGVYKSNNPVYNRLIVVDKENGGKADSLNVGVNLAQHAYVVCLDVDCVLEQDALLKMIKPFLEETKVRVIASGGVVRIANNCKIENGRLIKVNMPNKLLERIQIVEYIRAFLLGRMAWSRLNGLLLISGAFGAFDKEIVIKCGGYNYKTVGEDIELIVRMRRYMEENRLPYKVTFIPDPLCWTEVPSNYKVLGRQRNRWTRGTIETMRMHKIMFFNPRYGLLGMVSYPYWFLFEFLAPIIEFIGLIFFFVFAWLGLVQWGSFFILLGCILSFGFLYSAFAVLIEVLTYNQYKGKNDMYKLMMAAFLEPFIFHPFIVWSAIKGNFYYIRRKNTWGEMTRKGLNPAAPSTLTQPSNLAKIHTLPFSAKEERGSFGRRLLQAIREAAVYGVILLASMMVTEIFALVRNAQRYGKPKGFARVVGSGLLNDLSFGLNMAIIPAVIFIGLFLLNKRMARAFFVGFGVILVAVHATLAEYFLQTLVPLGAELFGYSVTDIGRTVGAAGIPVGFIINAALMLALVIAALVMAPKRLKFSNGLSFALLGLYATAMLLSMAWRTNTWKPGLEASNNISLNKSYFFYASCYRYLEDSRQKDNVPDAALEGGVGPLSANTAPPTYIDEAHYPFLHKVDPDADVLSPFFNKAGSAPNLVFIVVEGLGRAFSNKDAYLGSFTPFLDSLSEKSLYWSNFLSAGGRTFAMPPSIFGSLPFGRNGFLELGDQMPAHLSLFSVLRQNGYSSNFFYGGDARFDNMDKFMKINGTAVYDAKSFPVGYARMPASNSGFSWGFGDGELFRRYNQATAASKSPTCNVILTLSTHSPFLINGQEKYLQLVEQRMRDLGLDDTQKNDHRPYANQYASILYMDNSIRQFFDDYSRRTDFNNTIFIITGDHRMPEIPMSTKIDRYHVPLIIYSPLLRRAQAFGAVSSHFDITPSLLSFFQHQYNYKVPSVATWMGAEMDTTHAFRSAHAYPLMQTKNDVSDYLLDDYLLNGDDLFRLGDKMDLEPVKDEDKKNQLKAALERFRQKNSKLVNGVRMMPDSLLTR